MKPCDCKDMVNVFEMNETGVMYNGTCLEVYPPNIKITTSTTTLKLPQSIFKRFAEWYLADQKED